MTEKRQGEIAVLVLVQQILKIGFRFGDVQRKLNGVAGKIGVPVNELEQFALFVLARVAKQGRISLTIVIDAPMISEERRGEIAVLIVLHLLRSSNKLDLAGSPRRLGTLAGEIDVPADELRQFARIMICMAVNEVLA